MKIKTNTNQEAGMRERMDNIRCLHTARRIISLAPGQYFCETEKAYEIWDNTSLLRHIKRIEKRFVFFVGEK